MSHPPSANYIRSVLSYDPMTGIFHWLKSARPSLIGRRAGCQNDAGYVVIGIGEKLYYAHRLAWLHVTGDWPEHRIDHRNTFRSDNRFKNLRQASNAENMRNTELRSDNTSGFKGVGFCKIMKKWRAYITVDKKQRILGYFEDVADAAAARRQASVEHHRDFSRELSSGRMDITA